MLLDWAAILMFALGALYGFWHRENSILVVLGVMFVLLTMVALDKALHTIYVLTDDGKLTIRRGRFKNSKTILLADIKEVKTLPLAFRLGSYVLIELKDGKVESIQPETSEAFIAAIRKRL